MIKKLLVTFCIICMIVMGALANIRVDYNDIYIFKSNFADKIIRDYNISGVTDRVIYKYIILSINDAWNSYTAFPLYIYINSYEEESYLNIEAYSDIFQNSSLKIIEEQSKARFLRALYKTMKDYDLSDTEEPEWIMVIVHDEENEVIYMLEVNLSFVNGEKLENELVNLMEKISYTNDNFSFKISMSSFTLTMATYSRKYDELIVNLLFTDENGNVYGEAIMIKENIFVESM
ncbi:MAG: hypothetical protein KAX49_17210 [Halanaerobiales bacterium]|nr:hypothetical protein [Halanaerobiales bacterium]